MANGKIYFRYGVMGSGKTVDLAVAAFNFAERGIPTLVLKPGKDTRTKKIKSRIPCISVDCIVVKDDDNVYEKVLSYYDEEETPSPQWIIVDEAQFFSKEQIDQFADIADDFGTNIIFYGLRTDFRGEMFEGSKRIMEIADEFEELKSTCSCGRKASINARVVDDHVVTEGEQIVVGANEMYIPLCRKCWKKHLKYNIPLHLPVTKINVKDE